ncbi:MAG: DUF2065 domain-containing protein [Arenicellales bacterium]|nr:DUF2065 domain-containing protein [Arenicellales bacterium]
MINWQDLLAAVALVLVLEGIIPFINPAGLRRTLTMISELSDGQLRTIGMVSMVLGLILLFFVRH